MGTMKWYDKLYTSESIRDRNKDKIVRKIRRGQGLPGVYLITLASNPLNLLDIVPSWNLVQKYYPKDDLRVIGIANGYDDAVELVRQIIQDTYDNTGDVKVREYLRQNRRTAI